VPALGRVRLNKLSNAYIAAFIGAQVPQGHGRTGVSLDTGLHKWHARMTRQTW
jgi:hypothetical protein